MAKRMQLQIGGFDEWLKHLDELGGDVKTVVEEQLQMASETVGEDTADAMDKSNLPAKGKYSTGETFKTIILQPKVTWTGDIAEVGVGFDLSERQVGLLLITGTPSMRPNYKLEDIYARKKYMKWINDGIAEAVEDEIIRKMGG